jgi:hypothetical protein
MAVANTLAYCDAATVTDVKCPIVEGQDRIAAFLRDFTISVEMCTL